VLRTAGAGVLLTAGALRSVLTGVLAALDGCAAGVLAGAVVVEGLLLTTFVFALAGTVAVPPLDLTVCGAVVLGVVAVPLDDAGTVLPLDLTGAVPFILVAVASVPRPLLLRLVRPVVLSAVLVAPVVVLPPAVPLDCSSAYLLLTFSFLLVKERSGCWLS